MNIAQPPLSKLEILENDITELELAIQPLRTQIFADSKKLLQLSNAPVPATTDLREARALEILQLKERLALQRESLSDMCSILDISVKMASMESARENPKPPSVPTVRADIMKLLPKFKEAKTKDSNILFDEFLSRFETSIQGYAIPKPLYLTYFYNSLSECNIEQCWLDKFLKSNSLITWDEAKLAMIEEFVTEQEIQNRIRNLNNIVKGKEPMEIFATRFSNLYRSTGKDDHSVDSLKDQELFCKSLDSYSRALINAVILCRPASSMLDVYKYAIATDPHQYGKSLKRAFENEDSAPTTKKPDTKLHCEKHGWGSHTTSNCKNPGSSKCNFCNVEYYPGHNKVCQKNPQTINSHYAEMSSLDDGYAAYVSEIIGHPPLSSYYDLEGNPVETVGKANKTLDSYSLSPTILQKGQQYRVPILLGKNRVDAIYDSGCTTSAIDTELVSRFSIPTEKIQLLMNSFEGSNTGWYTRTQNPIEIACGKLVTSLVVLVQKLATGVNVLLGTDAGDRLGIYPSGIPRDYPDSIYEFPQSSVNLPKPSMTSGTTPALDQDRTKLLITMQNLIKINEAIPDGSFCNLAGSVVSLDVQDPNDPLLFKRQFHIPEAAHKHMNERVTDWLRFGIVKKAPPNTRYNCPIFPIFDRDMVTKRITGVQRIVIDPRPINHQITGDRFPVPVVKEIIDKIGRFLVISELDLKKSFHQFRLAEESQQYLAFTWAGSQYVFIGCPFGLKPLSSVFQRTMKTLFEDLGYVEIFVDNIIVFSQSVEEHSLHLQEVIHRLNQANLRLNTRKCHWLNSKLTILGHSISSVGVQIDQTKLEAAMRIPKPKSGKQVMSFLGLFNYFRWSIPRYAELAAPLEKLRFLKTIGPSEWTLECQNALDRMKYSIDQNLMLYHPDFARDFYIATDASLTGIGGVLYQLVDDKPQFVRFASRALTATESKLDAVRRELLGIVYSLRSFHYYVWGRRFTLFTDSRSLTFMFSQRDFTPMLLKWNEVILDYDFDLVHRPGIQNVLPDALSRLWPDAALTAGENSFSSYIAQMDLTEFVIPTIEERETLLERAHLLGHIGSKGILQSLHNQGISWPSIKIDALHHVEACLECQIFNVKRMGFHPLRTISAKLPGDHLAIDLAGPFEKTPHGNTFLLICVDVASRFVFLEPLFTKSKEDIAEALFKIFCTIGFPKILQSDNGSEFVNDIIRVVTKISCIDHRVILPYNPQANGLAESWVRLTKKILYKMLNGFISGWDRYIPSVQYSLNVRCTDIHGSTPFSLMFAKSHNLFQDYQSQSLEPLSHEDWQHRLEFMNSVVFPAIRTKSEGTGLQNQAKFAKRRHIVPKTYFKVNDLVLHKDPNVKREDPKWKPRWHKCQVAGLGPYGTFTLKNMDGTLITRDAPAHHIRHLRNGKNDTGKSLEFVRIAGHSLPDGLSARDAIGSDYTYLVHWNNGLTSWEPASQFDDISAVILYWKRRQDHPIPNDFMCPSRDPQTVQPESLGSDTTPSLHSSLSHDVHTSPQVIPNSPQATATSPQVDAHVLRVNPRLTQP